MHFQGLPARICWLGYGERDRAGARFNEMVASGELRGPIVIGRDHLDAGSVASPERETESMLDGSDAVADWPILNALLNTACGASWVSVHHGGGVGMGKSIHAGQVVVADGTPAGGRPHPPHAARRPGHGDRAPRRRRLSRGDRGGAPRRRAHADARPRARHAPAVTAGAPVDHERPASVSFVAAAEVLTPPREGLAHLRGDDCSAQLRSGGDLLVRDGRIAGPHADPDAELVINASGMTILPGLVDCHTHLPFAGWRASEYEPKLRGIPYEEISRAGGGIASSARALRESPDAVILAQSRALAREMLEHGTTAFECKSGYGLSREGELRALALAAQLDIPQTTTSTALLAHAVPPGHTAKGWMDEVEAMLPAVKALPQVTALDIFVESIAFGNDDLVRMGELARLSGLDLRCHAEQLSTMRSVAVAIEAGARSVDHLSRIHPDDVAALGDAQCAAVLLPGAEFLGAEERAPARALLDANAILVLATDLNPGTSPVLSLPLVIGLAARLYGLGTLEALAATTLNAAWVLGLHRELGSIEPGKRADLVLLDGPADQIAYRFGRNPVAAVFIDGRPVHVRPDAQWRFQHR